MPEEAQRVVQRDARVGQSGEVDDGPVGGVALLLEQVDEHALVVALLAAQLDPQFPGAPPQSGLDLGERGAAVDLRLAPAERAEIGPVEHQDPGHRSTSSSAARATASSTVCPGEALPRASSSTQRALPPDAFLSPAVRWSTAPG